MRNRDQTFRKYRRRTVGMIVLVVVIVMLLTGTLAWYNNHEHKTNEASYEQPARYDARLVEDYEAVDDWVVTDPPLTKEISVVNKGVPDDGQCSVYLRITLKEYLESCVETYIYTDDRYIVYNGERALWPGEITIEGVAAGNETLADCAAAVGRFVTFDTLENALAAFPGYSITNVGSDSVTPLVDLATGQSGFFIETRDDALDSQYGRPVITGAIISQATPLISGAVRASDDAEIYHHDPYNGECNYYPLHLGYVFGWADYADLLSPPHIGGNPFRQYVELVYGDVFISLTDFVDANNNNGQPVAKWIYNDTDPTDPYLYWGQYLAPGVQTAYALEQVSLLERFGDVFYYAMHVDMDIVSLPQLDLAWRENIEDPLNVNEKIPAEIRASYLANSPKIKIENHYATPGSLVDFNFDVSPTNSPVQPYKVVRKDIAVNILTVMLQPDINCKPQRKSLSLSLLLFLMTELAWISI